ncbi:adhesion domain-containing protein [Vibrio coralliilyticus]|uniref:adhesion domain-containing protein n=1 Tax=Vibrio coralliilyticus TaxID=190893 RepID=UPI001E2BE686|nr:DUF1566 domain-containing protein [Vibrio coralliilyticus]MCC2525749.1 DUF1566 domain-containing protein [Vibrio coralliilyticus]
MREIQRSVYSILISLFLTGCFGDNDSNTLYIPVCGSSLGDTDSTNSTGTCLKVIESNHKFFTSSPSISLVEYMGFTTEAIDDGNAYKYSSFHTENGTKGPPSGIFATFNNREGGHSSTFCTELNKHNFYEQSNWQMPSVIDLLDLYNLSGDLWTIYGWPAGLSYWTINEVPDSDSSWLVNLTQGTVGTLNENTGNYISCVSKPNT